MISALPAVLILFITFYSGILKVVPKSNDSVLNNVSHVAQMQIIKEKIALTTDEKVLKTLQKSFFNHAIDAILCVFFMLVALLVLIVSVRICSNAYFKNQIYPPLAETPYIKAS
ncbi:hypothetical protein AOH223_11810 [Helicobacter pylori]